MAREKLVISDFVVKVGVRVRSLRLERGLSMRKLAVLSGCSADGILQVEMGRSASTTKTLHKLAKALGVEPCDILNHDTHTNDLGWLIEMMRRDPKCVHILGARIDCGKFSLPK